MNAPMERVSVKAHQGYGARWRNEIFEPARLFFVLNKGVPDNSCRIQLNDALVGLNVRNGELTAAAVSFHFE